MCTSFSPFFSLLSFHTLHNKIKNIISPPFLLPPPPPPWQPGPLLYLTVSPHCKLQYYVIIDCCHASYDLLSATNETVAALLPKRIQYQPIFGSQISRPLPLRQEKVSSTTGCSVAICGSASESARDECATMWKALSLLLSGCWWNNKYLFGFLSLLSSPLFIFSHIPSSWFCKLYYSL